MLDYGIVKGILPLCCDLIYISTSFGLNFAYLKLLLLMKLQSLRSRTSNVFTKSKITNFSRKDLFTAKSPLAKITTRVLRSGYSSNLTVLLHRLRSCLLSTATVKLLQPSASLLVYDQERRRKAVAPARISNPQHTVTPPANRPREANQRKVPKTKES